jgi:hypothetical protein
MRHLTVLGSSLAVMIVASACATTSGTGATSKYSTVAPPQPAQPALGLYAIAARDSGVAQALADQVGPRVSIRAEVSSYADSRRIRGVFRLDDDAYVIVGHIDADGVLRIAFPTDPSDDGFVHGNRSYQTSEFFAGFNSEYRFRVRNSIYGPAGFSPDAYDGKLGYVFVIASWRPMRFDRFQTSGVWDSYELADDNYMRDPRPAIQELATLLAGDNTEAYTVKFARYNDTQAVYAGMSSFGSSFNSGYCAGYEPFGFASSPFGVFGYASSWAHGGDFQYRGSTYYYNAAEDCYRTGYPTVYGYGYPYRIAQTPPVRPTPATPNRPRIFDVDGHRTPTPPPALPGHFFPKTQETAPGNSDVAQTSPDYRRRGLITNDGPATGPMRREPRVEAQAPDEARTRPSIQEMINRRGEPPREPVDGGWARAQPINSGDSRATTGETRAYTRPEVRENPRSEPAPPRMQAPERASPPTRSEPAPRMQAPERSPAPERSSPPPSRPEPRSEPASRPPERSASPPAAAAPPRVETPVKPPR